MHDEKKTDNEINPLTLVEIGSDTYKPTEKDIAEWKKVFEDAQYDKDICGPFW